MKFNLLDIYWMNIYFVSDLHLKIQRKKNKIKLEF